MNAAEKLLIPSLIAVLLVFGLSGNAYAQSDCVESTPDIDISPSSLTVPPGETAVFTVEVENEDSDNCPIKQFTLNSTSNDGFSMSFSPGILFIQPDARDTSLLRVGLPSSIVNGTFTVDVRVTGGNFSNSESVTIVARQEIEECTVKVSSLRFKEKNADNFETTFSSDDEVSAFVDVSLIGNTPSDVILELFVDGNVFDSDVEVFPGDSDTTFKFGNEILTRNFNDDIDVEVVATPTCNPSEADSTDRRMNIDQSDDDVDIEVSVGRPGNTVVGKEIISRVFVENFGSDDVKVNIDASLCGKGIECQEMTCGDGAGESVFIVDDDDVEELVCKATPTKAGEYKVDVFITFEDDQDRELSGTFFVYSSQEELNLRKPLPPQILKQGEVLGVDVKESEKIREVTYVCSGNLRQAVYKTTEDTKVSDVEFCPFGCTQGRCAATPGVVKSTPVTVFDNEEAPKPIFSEPDFNPASFDFNRFFDWVKNLLFTAQN